MSQFSRNPYQLLYISLDQQGTDGRSVSPDHIALAVDEELGIVPLDRTREED